MAEAEVAGGEVGAVAEGAGGVADAFGGGFGDPAAPFVAEDEGDGGLGDAAAWATSRLVGRGAACAAVGCSFVLDVVNRAHGTYDRGVIRKTSGVSRARRADMAAGYLEILRSRHAARLLAGTLVGRLPNGTGPIAIVLFAAPRAALQPRRRARGGVRRGERGRTAAARPGGGPVRAAAGAVAGGGRVGVRHGVSRSRAPVRWRSRTRQWWSRGFSRRRWRAGAGAVAHVLSSEDQVHTAYAMDAVAQEVMFTVGPLLVTLCVSLWSPAVALVVLNASGCWARCRGVSAPSRAWRSAPREAHWLGALRSRGCWRCWGRFCSWGSRWGRSRSLRCRTRTITVVTRCTAG